MKAITIVRPGNAYALEYVETQPPEPRPGEVLIEVVAAGVNRADILQAMGRYPLAPDVSPILGLEVSGTIMRLGDGVQGWRLGDAVCALVSGGGYAEYVAVDEGSVLPPPPGVSLSAAAALPEAYFTVWANLMDAARLMPGERVLVHGGTSGIGCVAIQLCAAMGHAVYATAGSARKRDVCLALGAACAIDYRQTDFVDAVLQATEGTGIDVILDIVGADYIERNMRVAAPGGRIVNIAFQKGAKALVDFSSMLQKRLTLMSGMLRTRTNTEKRLVRDRLMHTVWPLFAGGSLNPVIDRSYPLADAMLAHQRMLAHEHVGKILLQVA